jgi:hypothetical protein
MEFDDDILGGLAKDHNQFSNLVPRQQNKVA